MKNLLQSLKQIYLSAIVFVNRWRVQQQPADPGSYHNLAKAYVEQSQWQAAIDACQVAIEIDPSPWFYKTLSEAYMGQGLWQLAITASQTAIQLDPEVSWLHHTLAKAYIGEENWQAAITACQRAIELDSQVSWFYYHLGEAQVKNGQWDEAIPTLRRAIELDPDFAWAYYYLGEALLAKADTEAAIEVYQKVTQQHPDIAYLRHCLEYAQHLQIQEQRIQAYCQKVRDQKARDPAAQAAGQKGERLRILMLTPYPTYPPKQGAIARMFHEMQVLGARHELVVVSFIFLKDDWRLETELANYCELGIMVMIGDALPRQPQQPKLIHRYSSERMRKLLRLLQPAQFDLVLCDFIYMAQYIDLFPDAYPVLAEHNIESCLLKRCAAVNQNDTQLKQLAQQSAAVKAFVASDDEADLLAAFEDQYWQKFNLRLVVSEQDQQEMNDRCQYGKTIVAKNGIDTKKVTLLDQTSSQTILFIGTMSYYPNIDGACYFVEYILPIIWKHNSEITFCIAGAEPPQTILDLAQDPRITVIANPEDMSDVARNCCMTVVPLRIGSGTRIKILHSLAMGLPVVSTRLGCEGLAVEDGVHLLVRDEPAAFAEAVLQLLTTVELQQRLRHNGRTLVEQEYDWQRIFQEAEQEIVANYNAWKFQKFQ